MISEQMLPADRLKWFKNKFEPLGWVFDWKEEDAGEFGEYTSFSFKSPRMPRLSGRSMVPTSEDQLLTWEASIFIEQVYGEKIDMFIRNLKFRLTSDLVVNAKNNLTPLTKLHINEILILNEDEHKYKPAK